MAKHLSVFIAVLLFSPLANGVSLPGHLSTGDLSKIVETLGLGGASRLLRSAEPLSEWPGIKIALETTFVPSAGLARLGDGTGSVPGMNPLPRIYLAKGLPQGLEIILNFLPSSALPTMSSFGGMLKWNYALETESWASQSVYLGVTRLRAFDSDYLGTTEEIGVVVSRDYVEARPYAGTGLMFTQGRVNNQLVASARSSAGTAGLHLFMGVELKTPANISLQLDLMNFAPRGSVSVGFEM